MNRTNAIQPLPFPVYYGTTLVLAIAGLIDSVYLTVSHFRVYTDIGYKSFCAISKAINCDTVSQSSYSIFIGLPIPVWGIIGYSFFLFLVLVAGSSGARKKRVWTLLIWISCFFSCYSVVLAVISTYIIGSYCIMCIGLYAVNLLLLFYTWIIQKRFSGSGLIKDTKEDIGFLWNHKLRFLPPLAAFLLSVVLAMVFYPKYWSFQPPPLRADIPKGITADGHPWIGAQDPVLEINEFADYQCFQCKKMHFFLRRLVNENPEKIRIVHRHYPMDHKFNPIVKEPFHAGSGKMSLLAIYATSKNKFWEINDLLYSHAGQKQPLSIKDLADEAGLDANEMVRAITDQTVRHRLQHDIVAGIKLGISGTPAYLIEGELYLGQIPPGKIKSAIE
jgi:protein-disulfide isomerase/uncharacterized membrane protein